MKKRLPKILKCNILNTTRTLSYGSKEDGDFKQHAITGGNFENVVNDNLKEATDANTSKTTLTCATCKYFVKITCFANYSGGLCGE